VTPAPLCRRCGVLLDPVLRDLGWTHHPRCWRDTSADDLADRRALHVIAAVFPTARRITPKADR
jgi:hypothetical protein